MSRRHSNYTSPSEVDIEHSSYGLMPYALILIALSLICFIGAFIQNTKTGETQKFTFAPEKSGQSHTLEVDKPNTVYAVTVRQSPSGLAENRGWSDVSIIIRSGKGDKGDKGDQLLSFGGDFWRASGYDEGPWSETKNSYTMKATFPHKGEYPVSIESSSSKGSYNQPVQVTFEPRQGSTLPLLILGIPALIAGVVMGYIANRHAVNAKMAEWSEN